jgi:hypothetical protein
MDDAKPPSLAQQLMSIGVGKSYAYMIASGERQPAMPLALRINRQLGLRLGPLAHVTDEQIAVLSQVHGEAA